MTLRYFTMLAVLSLVAGVAGATTVNLHPTPSDLNDLDHDYYYAWGLNWSPPAGEQITAASIDIAAIDDTQNESNDILNIRLVDTLPGISYTSGSWPGVKIGYDSSSNGDVFAAYGVALTSYSDAGHYPSPENFHYDLTAAQLSTLISYDSNGIFGITFDPDCHYNNNGITLNITSQATPPPPDAPMPEPITMLAVAMSAPAIGVYIRRRLNAASVRS
jgi:hypothetical protein